jgi:hypothetical protein
MNNTSEHLIGAGINQHTSHVLLTVEQVRRALALQTALTLLASRGCQVHQIRDIARWIYDGQEH